MAIQVPLDNPDWKASLPKGSPSKAPLQVIAQKPNFNESRLVPPSSPQSEAELRIVIHLFLEGIDPQGTSGTVDFSYRRGVQIVPWGTDQFKLFKEQAKIRAETFWSRRFRLWPPASYPYLNVPPTQSGSPTGVICTLQINYVTSAAQASFHVKCYMRAQKEVAQGVDSSMWTDAALMEKPMELADKTGTPISTVSATLAHEVGHLLGLDHSACSGQELVCYGKGGEAWQIKNVMGAGNVVNRSNASPWLERIEMHTGVAQAEWTVHTLDERGNPLYL